LLLVQCAQTALFKDYSESVCLMTMNMQHHREGLRNSTILLLMILYRLSKYYPYLIENLINTTLIKIRWVQYFLQYWKYAVTPAYASIFHSL